VTPERLSWPRRLSIALYRLLLSIAFPPGFLDEYGDEMRRAFADRVTGRDGARSLPLLWARTLLDLARHGAGEWLEAARAPRPAPFRGLGSDVRQALRSLAADPGFTLVALGTLALGVGANTAVFSVVDAVLLRPLPYPEPDRLVTVARWDAPAASRRTLSYPDIADIIAEQSTFEALAPYSAFSATVQIGETARRVAAAVAPPDLFRALGVEAHVGRIYVDSPPERTQLVALISARLADAAGGVEPGATLLLDGVSRTVTGIMPPGFGFPTGIDVWAPLEADENRNGHWLQAIGRLAPGVTPERAEEDLGRIVSDLAVRHHGRYVENTARVDPLHERLTRDARPILLVLLGTVGVVLLIACANLAGLSLVRATRRTDELRIRVALGARRGRLVRLVLVESTLVATLGALVGVPLAAWSAGALTRLAPSQVVVGQDVRLDLRVLVFTAGLTALAAVLSGLLPAISAARAGAPIGAASGRRVSDDRRTARARSLLVAGEVAMAVALLAGAGLLARTLVNLQNVPLGFEAGGVSAIPIAVRDAGGAEADRDDVAAFVEEARRRLLAVPGVRGAASVAYPPFGGGAWGTRTRAEGAPVLPRHERYLASFNAVTPGYFELLGIPLVRGRTLTEADGAGEPVAVVSESLARELWADRDALGQRLTNEDVGPDERWVTVVGIVADVKNDGLTGESRGEVYQPYAQLPIAEAVFLVSAQWERDGIVDDVRGAVRDARPGVVVPLVEPLEQWVDRYRGRARFGTVLVGVFAGLAVVLASLGVYGVIAYSVSRRRRELGLRLALGARPGELAAVVVRSGLVPAAVGTVLGVALAMAGGRVLDGLLFGVDARDPVTIAVVALIVLVVAGAASCVPALRASRSDPMVAMRSD
jgi:predicted permease